MRRVAVGRGYYHFFGNEQTGHNHAVLATNEKHGVDPPEYLGDVLMRVQQNPASTTPFSPLEGSGRRGAGVAHLREPSRRPVSRAPPSTPSPTRRRSFVPTIQSRVHVLQPSEVGQLRLDHGAGEGMRVLTSSSVRRSAQGKSSASVAAARSERHQSCCRKSFRRLLGCLTND